jgi:hypothetical protein
LVRGEGLAVNLRESAKEAPYCFGCGLPNPNGDLLCLAHTNELSQGGIETGRGASHKSNDLLGCIVCANCHWEIDGVIGGLTKDEKHAKQRSAWANTMRWWISTDCVRAA